MSKPRRVPPIVYILLVLGLGFGGYRYWISQPQNPLRNLFQSVRQAVPDQMGDLKLLGDTFSGYSTFRNPEFLASLEALDLTLQYEDEFDQAKRAERLNQGEADLLVTSLDQFLQQQPEGRIIALIDRTVGADAVVLNTPKYPGLTSLLVLNKLVATQQAQGNQLIATFAGDTPSEYLALVLDTKFEAFNLGDFEVVKVGDASESWAMLQDRAQSVALAVIWEPFVTQARQQGYTVVLSSRDTPGTIVDVLVASERLIASQPDQLTDLVEAYYRRIDANVRDASQLQTQIAEDGGLSAADAAAVLEGIEFFTAVEAEQWFTDGTLDRRIQATAAVLALAGRLSQVPEATENLFTSDFIAEAARNNLALIELVRADNPELADRLAGRTRAITPTLTATEIQTAPDIGNLQVRGEVNFATGSAQLSGESQATLNQLTREINEFSPQTVAVRIIGHTSRTGAADLNQTLSLQRAQVVVDYLKAQGLSHNFLAVGKGFSEPLENIDPTDPRNQRTEIRLVRVNTPS